MNNLVSFDLGDGTDVVVRISDVAGAGPVGHLSDGVHKAAAAFEDHLSAVRRAARSVMGSLREDLRPDELKMTFGIDFEATIGAVIASSSATANFSIEMTWKRSDDSDSHQ